jgi:hypothetical protein
MGFVNLKEIVIQGNRKVNHFSFSYLSHSRIAPSRRAVGVSADQTQYSPLGQVNWALHELVATAYAWLEVVTGR